MVIRFFKTLHHNLNALKMYTLEVTQIFLFCQLYFENEVLSKEINIRICSFIEIHVLNLISCTQYEEMHCKALQKAALTVTVTIVTINAVTITIVTNYTVNICHVPITTVTVTTEFHKNT